MTVPWYFMFGLWLLSWFILVVLSQKSKAVLYVGAGLLAVHVSDWLMKAIQNALPRKNITKTSNKIVFITGCDSGFGKQLAIRLHNLGFKVYAGCLFPDGEGAKELLSVRSDRLKVVQLDVTKEKDVRAAYKQVVEEMGAGEELWAVVNNAGIAAFTEIEWCPNEEYRKLLDVNSLGPIRVTKAFLPLLRRSESSRVVIVASLAGRLTFPGFSAYSMSKHATVSFADALRLEMRKWNISVHTVEPTLYRTPISNENTVQKALDNFWQGCPDDIKSSYGDKYLQDFKTTITNHLNRARPVEKIEEVIDDMVDAVAGVQPKSRYVPNVGIQIRARLMSSLPTDWLDSILLKGQPQTPPADIEKRNKVPPLIDPRTRMRTSRKFLTRGFSLPGTEKSKLSPPAVREATKFPFT